MVFRVLIHTAEEGGYWAEVPALPGCVTQGESISQIQERAREAILAYLDVDDLTTPEGVSVMEIAV
jgi:predicted RNase H-like HicB family nuclease